MKVKHLRNIDWKKITQLWVCPVYLTDFYTLGCGIRLNSCWHLYKIVFKNWIWYIWNLKILSISTSLYAVCCGLSRFSRARLCAAFMDSSLLGSSVHGILQARILEWVAMPFSRASSLPRDGTCVSYFCLHWQAGSSPLAPPGKPSLYATQYLFLIIKI